MVHSLADLSLSYRLQTQGTIPLSITYSGKRTRNNNPPLVFAILATGTECPLQLA